MRAWSACLALFGCAACTLASCASPPSAPPIDEAALAARVRAQVLQEIASREAALRAQEEEDAVADAHERVRIDIASGPTRGARQPLVVIVAFEDFQCPFTGRAQPTLARLLEEHPDDVAIVYRSRPLPFHLNAGPAAEAASEALAQGGSDAFWRMHDLLFANQQALGRADLETYAAQLGLNAAELSRALDEHTHQQDLARDQLEAARLGVVGTPTFFVNGRVLVGAQPYEEFDSMVAEEIQIATRDLHRGAPRSQLYARRMAHALERAPEVPREEPAPTPTLMPDPRAIYRVPVDGRASRGPDDALVTIVEFADLQCPFCARARATLSEIARLYGNDVRFVFRHHPLPFHPWAMTAAEVAAEVRARGGASAFFRFCDLIFDNQSELDRAAILRLAVRAGANRHLIERALDQHTRRVEVDADVTLAEELGALGTPSFFINGRNLRGAQPLAAFQALIDEELSRARDRVSHGTPRDRIYEESIANGATTPQRVPGVAPTPSAPALPDDYIYPIDLPASAPTRGPASARVTLQLFADFQCPFSSRIQPTLGRVLSEYGSSVRLVWRDYPLPFHNNAILAAEAAREVFRQQGDDAFWRYRELLYENQADLRTATLLRLAQQIPHVDGRRMRRALEQHTHRAAVQADIDAISHAGAQIGTPSLFINGRLLQGAQPFEVIRTAIDRALAR